jgi:hypothetical protein
MELEHGGRRYPVPAGELTLGSDPGSGVVLTGARPRHAAVRLLGDKMATVRGIEPGAEITVNGVAVGGEPTPLLHGDVIRIGSETLKVINPAHQVGEEAMPPEGARERLHDTAFGIRRADIKVALETPSPVPPPPPPAPSRRGWIIAVAVALVVVAYFLLR